jgi:site-specific recombinase XerD
MLDCLNRMALLLGTPELRSLDGRTLTCLQHPWHTTTFAKALVLREQLGQVYKYTTVNKHLSALRGVLKMCWRNKLMSGEDYHAAVSIESIGGSSLPAGRSIRSGELAALMDVCARDPRPIGRRDAALIAVLYTCGLRRAEASALDLADYERDMRALTIRGKRNKERLSYIPDTGAADAVKDWLAVRGDAPGPLFYSIYRSGRFTGRRLARQSIYDALAARAKMAGVAKLSPHDFRRTFVGDLLEQGADIAIVQKMAGHASVVTTARYDRRGEEAKMRAADRLHVPYRARESHA